MPPAVTLADPFGSPELWLWDSVRLYSSLAGIVVLVGQAFQLISPQPQLGDDIQNARRLSIVGTMFFLLGDIGINVERFGEVPATYTRLIAHSIGVTVLLIWMFQERRARRSHGQ